MLYAVGAYGRTCDIDWAAVGRVAFVCIGNICRSPYASARARSLGIPAVSFGLEARDGSPADPVASRNALLRGVDLSAHRASRAESCLFAKGDLVIVFEPAHLAEIRRRTERETSASLLGVFAMPVRPHIEDPYGRSDRYFQKCFSVIDANVAAIARNMVRHRAAPYCDETGRFGPSSVDKGSRDGTFV
jgi:protein-tyrosine phosphatase